MEDKDLYWYRATVGRVVDGDTVDLGIDLGFYTFIKKRVRLYGINTPERGKEGFKEAKEYLSSKLPLGCKIDLQTIKDKSGKYGRVLGILWLDSINLNDDLLEKGLATKYE